MASRKTKQTDVIEAEPDTRRDEAAITHEQARMDPLLINGKPVDTISLLDPRALFTSNRMWGMDSHGNTREEVGVKRRMAFVVETGDRLFIVVKRNDGDLSFEDLVGTTR